MKKGFTLSEIMVAIGLIGIFASFSVINLRGGDRERGVRNEAMKVIDGVKKIQTMALAGKSVDGETPRKYIFQLAGCKDCTIFSLVTDSGFLFEPQTSLENAKINVYRINEENIISDNPVSNLDISFSPPRAQPAISSPERPDTVITSVTIRIESDKDRNIARCVSVNAVSGRIDLENCP